MTIEGIIFDLDGTLVDTIEDIGDATNTLLKIHGYSQYTTEDFIRWIGNGAAKFIEEAMGEEVEPVQLKNYVSEFKEITVHTDRRALIPRPETELLVEIGLQLGEGDAQCAAEEVPDLRAARRQGRVLACDEPCVLPRSSALRSGEYPQAGERCALL